MRQNFLVDGTGHVKLTDFGLATGALNPAKIEDMKNKVSCSTRRWNPLFERGGQAAPMTTTLDGLVLAALLIASRPAI
jgi:serine/threonine protein kinase